MPEKSLHFHNIKRLTKPLRDFIQQVFGLDAEFQRADPRQRLRYRWLGWITLFFSTIYTKKQSM